MRNRKEIRLKDYDYSTAGYYFITICTKNRECIFGDIPVNGNVQLNDFGTIVEEELRKSQTIRKEILLDHYVIMPNHVHCIIVIEQPPAGGPQPSAPTAMNHGQALPYNCHRNPVGADGRPPPMAPQPSDTGMNRRQSLSSFVQGFKSAVTTRINMKRHTPGKPVWQRSFYDHIIRNEPTLNAVREYITHNPVNWEKDIDNLITGRDRPLPPDPPA